eukprot:TRINITY_DN4880_c1_g6_i1.p1 TRINITY_DN4880_c1_g6~~TRINITY_DN4880_c1_g6_i1.p1  ORF type:complete len:2835 (+),score=1340.55 TRINITY_DN4880_c1_g6_i1:1078-8505(+)
MQALISISKYAMNADVRKAAITTFCATLKVVKSVEERNVAMATLNMIVPLMFELSNKADKVYQDTAKLVKDLVYPAIKPYPSHACFELMGCCIERTGTVPDYIATTLKDVSTNADESIRLRLLALLPVVAEADPKKVKDLQPTLAKMCEDSQKKPGMRAAALLALAVVDPAPQAPWYVDGCLGTAPVLFSIENLRRFTEPWQLVAAVRTCRRFLPPATQKGGAPAGFSSAKDLGPMIGLVLMATHPRNVVRSAATAAIKDALQASPALAYLFWTSLMIVLWGAAPADEAAPASPTAGAKPAVKPGGKAAAKPAAKKGAAKPAAKKGGPAAAAAVQAAPVHPLVVDKKDYGKARRCVWTLSEAAITEQFEHDRTEFPLAADVYTLLAGRLFADGKLMSPVLLREVLFTCGHCMVSGPMGQYWDCTTVNYAAYRNNVDTNAFASLFGINFHPEKTIDTHKVPGHFLFANRDDAAQGMAEALRDCGDRDHCRVAAARAMSFLTLHSGSHALEECLVVPPVREAEMEFPPSDDEDEEGAKKEEEKKAAPKPAAKPAAPAPVAAEGEAPMPSRLCALMRAEMQKMLAFNPLELKLVECDHDALFEAAVQKQLEDDDVIPRTKAQGTQQKRDKAQKKMYSKEDEDWERAYVAKKNAELGIEDPKVAKARVETREKFTVLRKDVKRHRQALNGYLLAVIEVCRDARNTPAAHDALPHLVPVLIDIIRTIPVRPSVIRAVEVLEWLFHTTPVTELKAMALTLANLTQELVYERPHALEGGKKAYDEDIISMTELLSKRLRQVCNRLLPPPSYSIIFPICQTVMNHVHPTASFSMLCQQQTLAVVMTNCSSPGLPHKAETCEALLTQTERTASMSKTATNALVQLAEHLDHDLLGPVTEGLLRPAYIVREACVLACKAYPKMAEAPVATRYFLLAACHDINRGVQRKAQEAWKYHDLTVGDDYVPVLVPRLFHPEEEIQQMVAAGVADGTQKHIETGKLCLQTMCREFDGNLKDPKKLKKADRAGVAQGFLAQIPNFTGDTLEIVTKFCCLRALCDVNDTVREAFLTAFRKIVTHHGKEHHAKIFPTLQKYFQDGPPAALGPAGPAGALTPPMKEAYTSSVVVVMGALSAQMDKPTHLDQLATKLIEIAQTPSPTVAKAVCETMATIIGHESVAKAHNKLVTKCMEKLLKGGQNMTYDTRKSQAHALAGIVKGLHLPCLYEAQILPQIENALAGKNSNGKEGALAAFSVLCSTLDGLFEPYVISMIQSVVNCFADKDSSVKRAAEECSGSMMQSLTDFGVRQILPPLLEAFESDAWRTKVSALGLLGQMSYCSPQQLAAALPKVMPTLNEQLCDTHKDVQASAYDALRRVGGVITNPEIACNANLILLAIKNPDTGIDNALEALLCTHFVNAVDAASLALIEPILRRGLTERVSAIKVKAASIIGSVALLVRDKTIIMPYVNGLMTPLKRVLLDEYPDCRSTAAKAMGSLVNLLGVDQFPNLLAWCFDALQDVTNSHVERSGAAQGACQLVVSYPDHEVEGYLTHIKESTHHEKSQVREGYLQVLVYLPHAMGPAYQPHLKDMTPCVVMGLSDDSEGVRNMAVKAGQTLVHLFGMKCLDQLLPPLQQGLMNWEWRVRLSSLQLLGDLLMRVATENMKIIPQRTVEEEDDEEEEEDEEDEEEEEDDDEDDNLIEQKQRGPLTLQDLRRMRKDKTTNSLVRALGEVIGDQVLGRLMSAIYMLTSDNVMDVVRQARQVWKALVDNTPAMLRTIIDDLTPKLVEYITEDSEDQREIGGRCIGDLVSRLGDGFLPVILPILSKNLQEDNAVEIRLGAVLGLKEVVKCISRAQLASNQNVITPAIVQAIKDEDELVREEAGLTFDIMFRNFGGKAIETLMQNLISAIVTNDETAMAGTLEMVKMRPKAVLAQLIPTFIKSGVLTSHLAMGLEKVAQLAEDDICMWIVDLLPLFADTLAQDGIDYIDDVIAAVQAIVENAEAENLYAVMNEVRLYVQSTDGMRRRGGLGIITALVSCDIDLSEFNTAFIQNTIRLFADREEDIQERALDTMLKVAACLEEQGVYTDHTNTVHGALQAACFGGDHSLVSLDRPMTINGKKALGLNTVLGFYTKPLQAGTAEEREFAAHGIVEVLDMVDTTTVKACVGDIIGPMIRRMAETMPSTTKVSIMTCISACIKRVGTSAKQFIVMLQNAFPKNLANVDSDVRRSALRSMWVLMNYQEPKLDPTLNSLMLEAKGAHPAIQTAVMRGITLCLESRPEAALGAKILTNYKDIIYPCWNRVATVPHAAAVGKTVGMMAPLVDEHVTREVIDKAADAVKEGGSLVVLGMSAWAGLLARGYGRPGFYHQDYVVFVEQATGVLPELIDSDQQLATVRACLGLCQGGGVAEIGVNELLTLSSALCKLGEKVLTGDREKTVLLEDTLRCTLEHMIEYIPAKFQQHLTKLTAKLANLQKSEWETSPDCQDDKRDDEM